MCLGCRAGCAAYEPGIRPNIPLRWAIGRGFEGVFSSTFWPSRPSRAQEAITPE